jgi:hypothetical protein
VALPIQERIIFTIVDPDGKSVPNAEVSVYGGVTLLERGKSLADGSYLFFPSEYGESLQSYTVEVSAAAIKAKKRITVSRTGERKQRYSSYAASHCRSHSLRHCLRARHDRKQGVKKIERLKATIRAHTHEPLDLPVKTDLRFVMVLYKDRG